LSLNCLDYNPAVSSHPFFYTLAMDLSSYGRLRIHTAAAKNRVLEAYKGNIDEIVNKIPWKLPSIHGADMQTRSETDQLIWERLFRSID